MNRDTRAISLIITQYRSKSFSARIAESRNRAGIYLIYAAIGINWQLSRLINQFDDH